MLLRYCWGLGVGHTYSHVRHSTTDEVVSAGPQSLFAQGLVQHIALDHSRTITGTLLAHSNGCDDLENELSMSHLDGIDWELPQDEAESGWGNNSSAEGAPDLAIASSISLTHPDGFDDLDTGFSFADLDAFEWVAESRDKDGGDSESDDDSGHSVMYYEIYGSDCGNNDLFD
jgi:hypothetical protein